LNDFVVVGVVDRVGNGASHLVKNASIDSNDFLVIFGTGCAVGVELVEDECVGENFSIFDLSTINCFAFLINLSSSCK
jgi:hypothetical protein